MSPREAAVRGDDAWAAAATVVATRCCCAAGAEGAATRAADRSELLNWNASNLEMTEDYTVTVTVTITVYIIHSKGDAQDAHGD